MAIQPNPYKLVCPNCGSSKIVAPRSDAFSPKDLIAMSPVCSKCGNKMERKNIDKFI
ncbi:TFIIB-type zinc ribbon-containing protein [Arcobacter defluvii]|uniref:Uncharacterized protein n=1 Tax=Arcobacter defluvii TaxID=873191 RepID=A0AAE7BEX1_9BACT|nr:TFIIB-type zinc ribbon-containing protein [Arcobacter defluvii]QKF78225.1 hypothetical protein ADFLV_2217 [Arcobacter defluvii]